MKKDDSTQSSIEYSIEPSLFDGSDSTSNYSDDKNDQSSSDEEIGYITEQEVNTYKAVTTHVVNNCVQDSIRALPFIEPPSRGNRSSLKKVLWPLKQSHCPGDTDLLDSIINEISIQKTDMQLNTIEENITFQDRVDLKEIALNKENTHALAGKIYRNVELILQAMTDELQVYSQMTEIESLDEDFLLRAAWVHGINESVVLNARKRSRLFNSQYLNLDDNTFFDSNRFNFKSTDGSWRSADGINNGGDKEKIRKNVEFICKEENCGKKYTTAQALLHHSKHGHINYTERPFKCDYEGCNKKYIYLRTLTDHIKRRHYLLSEDFPKPQMKESLINYNILNIVSAVDVNDELDDGHKTVEESQPETDIDLEKQFKCNENGCNRAYFHRRTLSAHIKARHSEEAKMKEKVKEKEHRCEVEGCNKSYRNKRTLDAHIKTRHGNDDHSDGRDFDSGVEAYDISQ